MARCEDWPCCGHEAGCCPTFINGEQQNMVCVCGKELPVNARYSCCEDCLRDPDALDEDYDPDEEDIQDYEEDPYRGDDFEDDVTEDDEFDDAPYYGGPNGE